MPEKKKIVISKSYKDVRVGTRKRESLETLSENRDVSRYCPEVTDKAAMML